jgi:tripartite-type tricarboxylate transporter receptor subunit TctC
MNGNAKHLPRAVATVLLFVGLIAAYPITQADASSWPSRTVRIITGPAGSSSDAVVRTLAEVLSPKWKQAIVVENRPGGDHILAARAFLDAQDGHTLLFTTHSTLTVNPLLHERLPYDPVRDFAPITLAVEDFLCVVASPSLAVNSMSDLVELARAKPGTLNSYAVPGSPHLSWLAFQGHSGITTAFIAYTSPANVLVDLSEGRIHVALMPLAAVLGQARAGKVKVLAVTNAIRTPAAPETPTFVEAGYPDFAFGGLLGLFGPKDMPAELRERISADVRTALAEPDVKQRLTNRGLVARGTTPAGFSAILDEQRAKWSALARAHGIKPKAH